MPRLPSPRPSAGNAPGWRDAFLAGELTQYAADRFNGFADALSDALVFAIDRPDRALVVAAVALYDGLGALWDMAAPALGEAITDIRKKFEEFAWEREVTPREMDISREPPSVETRMGFRELIAMQAAMLPHTPEQAEQARKEPEISGPDM